MKILSILILFFCPMLLFAQSDTSKVEQYCEMVAMGKMFSNKVTIDVDFGEERKFFSGDKRIKDEVTGKIKKFNSVTDALNYLGSEGWVLVNAFPLSESSGKAYHFYFKKLFNKTDVIRAEDK